MDRDLSCVEEAGIQVAVDDGEAVGPGLANQDGLEEGTFLLVRVLGIQMGAASFPEEEAGDLSSQKASEWVQAFS